MQNNILQVAIDWTGQALMVKMSLAKQNWWILKWGIKKLVIIISSKGKKEQFPKTKNSLHLSKRLR